MVLSRMVAAVWQYKGFITGIVRRELQARYMGSMLGASWNIINPLILIIIYTVIFSQVMMNRFPGTDDTLAYSIYLCSGLLTWGWFADIVSRSQTLFLENSNLLKKASFPRICLPVALVISATVNFLIIFGLFLVFLIFSGRFPGMVFLALIPVLIIQLMLSIGLGIFTGTLNVFFRDVGNFMSILLQFWFWLTPIVYPMTAIPTSISRWFFLNPMVSLMEAYHRIFIDHMVPHWETLIPTLILAFCFLFLAGITFYRCSGELVDEL